MYQTQLNILKDKMEKVPDDSPNRGLWESLFSLLAYWGSSEQKIEERMDRIEGAIKVIRSDARETKNMVSKLSNGGIKFDAENHPHRRRDDPGNKEDETPERTWFINKVLPGLTVALITSIVSVLTVVVALHITDLLK